MPTFQQTGDAIKRITIEDTDRPLPEVLNPRTRYRIISTIAKGGKSLIQSCMDMHLGRTVAYKTLRKEFIGNEIEERRLLREARVSAMLNHPNTIPIYELGRDGQGHYYFTMKLVHGYTLREVLNYRDRYDLNQLIDVVEQVAHVIESAHFHGVAHRDIKPENILVGPFGETLLLDWGFAKVWHSDGRSPDDPVEDQIEAEQTEIDKTMTGFQKLQGTLCYMSPEQMTGDPGLSYSTDVYSLGVVLYEILASQLPFDSDHAHEILDAVKHNQAKPPSSVSKYPVPKTLEELAMSCLKKTPADRPSIADFLRTLQEEWALDQMLGGRHR